MSAIEELERYYTSASAAEDRAETSGAGTANQSVSEFSPATTDGQASTSAAEDDSFVTHMLQKSDTLAGLAVQYNVAVSDIKRANGLMSESMMWVRCAPNLTG
jgi:LysM repeat protein